MTPEAFAAIREYGFPLVAVVLLVWGGLRRLYVWGWQYDQVIKERDEYRQLAWDLANAAHRAIDVGEVALTSERPVQPSPTRGHAS